MMMENPNLIRRPIMIKGSKVDLRLRQGSVRQTLTCASARRAGTTRRARARGTASSIRRRAAGRRASTSSSFYAEHFDTVEVNSTFYGQPRAEVTRAWAARTPAGFEFSVKLYQKFTHPRMFKERLAKRPAGRGRERTGAARRAGAGRTTPTSTPSAAASIRSPRAAGSARCWRSFRPASRTAPASRDYLAGLLGAFADYPIAVELRHKTWSDRIADTLTLLNAFNAALGADRRAEIPLLDPAELPAQRARASTTCGCTAGTPRSGGRTRNRKTATTISTPADELKEFSETADAAQRAGEEAVSLHQQSLLGEVGRQRRDDQAAARASRSKGTTRRSSSNAIRSSPAP